MVESRMKCMGQLKVAMAIGCSLSGELSAIYLGFLYVKAGRD
jgi:hypothetical protein